MNDMDVRALRAITRQDFGAFTEKVFHTTAPTAIFRPNWHLEAIAYHLQLVKEGKIRRLIINLPPRSMKSIISSVALPAFLLGHDPSMGLVCASYSSELSAKLARDCRAVMTQRWYRDLFPETRLSRDRNAELDFMTTRRGSRLATSVGGTLTGRGGDFLIIDDAQKAEDVLSQARRRSVNEWFDGTAYTRLDDKKRGAIVVVMQRLHMEDLTGHLLSKNEGWVVLSLPAIAWIDERIPIGPDRWHQRKVGDLLHPAREDQAVLDDLQRQMGTYHFSAQYLQAPLPEDGEIFKLDWFRSYDTEPSRDGGEIVQSWDTASKGGDRNDFSVCTTWLAQGKDYYLLDIFRKKLTFPELLSEVRLQAQRWRPNALLIEDKASGTALLQELGLNCVPEIPYPIAVEPEGDKITRAGQQSTAIEAGHVLLPAKAEWLTDLRNELVQFPNGRHDDQIDSITQFLKWIRQRVVWATEIKTKFPT